MIRMTANVDQMLAYDASRALYRYWSSLRSGPEAPFRSSIDPRKICSALAHMFILESLPTGELKFRLAGTRICELIGMELRGMRAGAIMEGSSSADLFALCSQVANRPGVGLIRVSGDGPNASGVDGEIVVMPVKNELGELTRILGAVSIAERGLQVRGPMRFTARHVELLDFDLRPMEAASQPAIGMAEAPATFSRGAGGKPTLATETQGGGPRPKPSGRSHLRLVKG